MRARRAGAAVALPALAAVVFSAVSAAQYPAFPVALLLLIAGCCVAVWLRPLLALAIAPAALPVLDFAPWSGRFYWNEFDLLLLACLAVGVWRSAAAARRRRADPLAAAAFGLLALSLAISTARALWPWPGLDDNSFNSYYSPFNALRIVKGALWAWATVWLFRRFADAGEARSRMLTLGLCVGLAATVAFIVWERLAFVGLFDFASDYRVTGPISAMHKGGAYIECYLAVGAAFAASALLQSRRWTARFALAALLLGATYALAVTYSRNGYAAFALALLAVLAGQALPSLGSWQRAAVATLLAALVGALALPIVGGPFARARLTQSGADLATRQAHWADALRLRDAGWATALVGMGLGRFPESHFWRSQEPLHAGSYRLQREQGKAYLRLGAGSSIYLEQIVDLHPGQDYVLSARVRSNRPSGSAGVMLCQKWLLTSLDCESAALASGPEPGVWRNVEVTLAASKLGGQAWYRFRPLKLALVTPGGSQSVDVGDLRLAAVGGGGDVLANGDFSAGLDHWFFTTDADPPWHIHSLPVAILFDQGWLGVLAGSLLGALALARASAAAWRGSSSALAALAGLLAFLVSGSLNTLIDSPRLLWLLLLLLWLCADGDRANDGAGGRAAATRG